MSEGSESVVDAARAWLEIDGVEGIAEGSHEGKPCVVVLTSSAPEALRRRLPARILGLPVIVRHSRALPPGLRRSIARSM
jgi:hypothetical protein